MSAIAGRVLLIPKGNYDSTATYTMLDMVVYNGSSYICKQECTGVVPTNTTYWMLNASGSAVAYINDIGDVVITNVSNGQVLMYDSTTQKWVNGTITTTLAGLTDTQIASLSNGQVLKYNATSQKWENAEDTGGLLPHLIIISETGSTVTATKGQTVITATETSTGHFECDVPEFGTWTIDAILGGDDAQVSLVVDTVKVYTVDDSHFHATVTVKYPSGATCRLQSADETLYATGSPYTFTVHHAETYTITVTYNQRIYTDTVTFTTEGQSFSKTLPSPSEVDANDLNLWLWFGGVSGTYSTLADVLADSTALATLMASTDAVDYLVRCKDWTGKGLVPIMTSNTTPSGECFSSSVYSSDYMAYKAFDSIKANANTWMSNSLTNAFVGYRFTQPQKCYSARVTNYYKGIKTCKIQGSNDGATWIDLTSTITFSNGTDNFEEKNIIFTNNIDNYLEYRVFVIDSYRNEGGISVSEIQFYPVTESIPENQSAMSYIGLNNYCANTLLADEDWLDGIANSEYFESVLNVKVPTMTSNTTPSGECSADSSYSNDYLPFRAFDGDIGLCWLSSHALANNTLTTVNSYIQYQFNAPKKIFMAKIKHYSVTGILYQAKFIGIYGNITEDLTEENTYDYNNGNYRTVIFTKNIDDYDTYKFFIGQAKQSSGGPSSFPGLYELQFYGRADV